MKVMIFNQEKERGGGAVSTQTCPATKFASHVN